MFYSQENLVVDHDLTYLHTQKVFTGQYWDEFALTCSLVPDQGKVLMLGLSMGGGIRPILSSTKKIELTCVDYDENSVENCRQLYKKCFPDVIFQSIVADAAEFLKNDTQKYDAIWFDIYESAAYSLLAFDSEFIGRIQNRLTSQGVLLVNSYGLPNHFSPIEKNGVQQNFVSFLKMQFGSVASIPYRRNMTFIASSAKAKIYSTEAHGALNAIDRFTFDFMQKRTERQISFNKIISENKVDVDQMQFAEIDTQMRQAWSNLRDGLNESGFNLKENSEFIFLIQNQNLCIQVIKHLIQNGDASVCFIPILASGESHIQRLNIDWLFDWTEENQNYLSNALKSDFQLVWMAQLWALIIHPHGRYKKYYFRYLALIRS